MNTHRLFTVLVFTAAIMVLEAVGGWWTGSLALLSDALHMALDVGALVLSLWTLRLSSRASDEKMNFGYHRAEILGGLINGLAVFLLAGGLIWEAVHRLLGQTEAVTHFNEMITIAGIGLLCNLFGLWFLKREGDDHAHVHEDHAHAFGHGDGPVREGDSFAIRGATLHLISDLLGSVGAVTGGVVLVLTGWQWVDPVISLCIASLILWGGWRLVRDSALILMESVPVGVDYQEVRSLLLSVPGVKSLHHLHIWGVTHKKTALCVHLVTADNAAAVLTRAQEALKQRVGIDHVTIQIEDDCEDV